MVNLKPHAAVFSGLGSSVGGLFLVPFAAGVDGVASRGSCVGLIR